VNRFRYIPLAAALIFVPFLLTRQAPEAKAANRIRDAYLAAERSVLRPSSGMREAERFLGKLKEIDTGSAPEDVQRAMTLMISAVEARVYNPKADANAANERIATAKKDLIRALERWRGQPF
jgi:hypothetical protein